MKETTQFDDLTAIKGIGPARQRWLRDALGVRTYDDLSGLSVAEIEAQLKADRQIQSRSAIEEWLIEARALADAEEPVEASSLVREDGWQPFASFVVEFQAREPERGPRELRTAVHHMEKDRGTHWPGIEHRELCRWMVDQIRGEVDVEPEEVEAQPAEPDSAPHRPRDRTRVEIREVRLLRLPDNGTRNWILDPWRPFEEPLEGGEPFVLEVDLELTGPAAGSAVRQQVELKASCTAYDRGVGRAIDLGESEPLTLQPGKLAYTFALPPAALRPGSYRLWVKVAPPCDAGIMPDYVEIPLLHVE